MENEIGKNQNQLPSFALHFQVSDKTTTATLPNEKIHQIFQY